MTADGLNSVAPDDDEFDVRKFEELPARNVPISALSPGLFLRQSGTNAAHVQLLNEASGSSELPPILVQQDGCRVIDGLHRLEAAKLRGDTIIRARFLDCTDSEALVLAMKANSAHGLPLSNADRVSGAKRVLTAHPDWSDRAIASITGLSAKTIKSLRSRSAAGAHLSTKRLGRDGRRRPITAGEGRRRAAEYIMAHPDAPLRQVALEADVSLGTAHDVSARVRRGASPERNGHRVSGTRPAAVRPAGSVADVVTVSPGANNDTPLWRKDITDTPLTWAGVAPKVATDPTVRYTEGGKEFLRWMALHASDPDGWRAFVNAIPAHWLSVLTPIADSIGREWSQFAEQLKQAGSDALGA
ncbi:nuclease [Kibdelosporangium aridum]|uniref:Nuclease n=1 Tax=Kibdelosporangium aridum TaxID=2030 RepID=A0A428Z4Q7_KIBAR|nr:ParB N-terminal domain-containing protein [Kibdelosporangium aridum]RSM81616.1 nuclease [Kibdelosporangium aridum]